jgi:hypothetical protein
MKKLVVIFLIGMLLFSCKEVNNNPNQNQTPKRNAINKSATLKENFDVFLGKFSTDSLFQHSRIKFPLRNEVYNSDNGDYEISKIDKEKWKFFNIKALPANYITKLSNKSDYRYIFNVQIIDTGVNVDYIFMALDGKWMLINIVDSST